MMIMDVVGSMLIVAGSLCGVAGAIGLLRFANFHTRLHAAGVTDSLCAILVILGLMCLASTVLIAVKLLIVLFFLLFSTPTASYVLARTALNAGFRPPRQKAEGGE
jgi:multicomponent Na+:H+ antiporter subunit G